MKTFSYLAGAILTASCFFSLCVAQPVPVKMKSARPCTASVEDVGDAYLISIAMRPVRCFDAVTNKSVSFQKAEALALSALLEYLQPKEKNAGLKCTRNTVTDRMYTPKSCNITCRIVKSDVSIINPSSLKTLSSAEKKAESNRQTSAVTVSRSDSIFTLQADYQDTINQLETLLINSLPPFPTNSEQAQRFASSISDSEELIDKQYQAFKSAIENESLLLSIESQPLLDNLKSVKKKAMDELSRRVKILEQLESIQNFSVKTDFAFAVLSSPFIMENGGVEVVNVQGEYVLIAVGIAPLAQNKPGENKSRAVRKIKALRVAEMKAKAKLAAEKSGVNIEVREEYTETVTIKNDNGKQSGSIQEEYNQRIQSSVSALIRNVRQVGSWESSDGELVFCVLGAKRTFGEESDK